MVFCFVWIFKNRLPSMHSCDTENTKIFKPFRAHNLRQSIAMERNHGLWNWVSRMGKGNFLDINIFLCEILISWLVLYSFFIFYFLTTQIYILQKINNNTDRTLDVAFLRFMGFSFTKTLRQKPKAVPRMERWIT